MTDSTTPWPQFVAYYRVSTDKQGKSGLGLEAQINAVQQHTGRSGGAIIAEFQEVESGKHDDRPEQAFYMVGTIDEAVQKGRELSGEEAEEPQAEAEEEEAPEAEPAEPVPA